MKSNSFCNPLILLFYSKSSFSPAKGKIIEQNMSLTVHVFKIFGISMIMQHEICWHCKSTLNRTTWVNYLKEAKSICFKTQTQFESDVSDVSETWALRILNWTLLTVWLCALHLNFFIIICWTPPGCLHPPKTCQRCSPRRSLSKQMDKCTKMILFFFWIKKLKEDNEDYSWDLG